MMSRRQYLDIMAAFAVLFPAVGRAQSLPADLTAFLASYADTLLPRDSTPSASDLNAHLDLIDRARSDADYQRLILGGKDAFDQASLGLAGTPFARASDSVRESIVARAEQQKPGTLPWIFFTVTRADLFIAYYARPESWPGLGLDRPPQPFGYPDHDQPPHHVLQSAPKSMDDP